MSPMLLGTRMEMESPVAVSRTMGVSFCKLTFCGSLVMGIRLLLLLLLLFCRVEGGASWESDGSSTMGAGTAKAGVEEGERASIEGGGCGGRRVAS